MVKNKKGIFMKFNNDNIEDNLEKVEEKLQQLRQLVSEQARIADRIQSLFRELETINDADSRHLVQRIDEILCAFAGCEKEIERYLEGLIFCRTDCVYASPNVMFR